ncbi:uncharacterized protein I206_106113 [Kwoniella pini CBS 10737]|uniref:Uncharacterized protein n=1 Tax=Kwoniella pini CBS 10737 TaxID=1296096 RepID=A0A1B9I1B1_9TREE|nr:uncharacterized protein I206_04936 [Kwoniella pini CBS 10737]OCF49248.1 hypothetical protein I206_04936 [Kwoniella pini CBS 10737]
MSGSSSDLQHLIAHYLAQNYPSVLPSFLAASCTAPPDLAQPPVPDLRTLVEDYASQAIVRELENVQVDDEMEKAEDGSWKGWTAKDIVKLPLAPEVKLGGLKMSIEGISAMNLLAVGEAKIPKRVFDTNTASYRCSFDSKIITTSVDKSLRIIDRKTGEVEESLEPHSAAVLSFAVHPQNPRYLLTGSMDGTAVLTDLITSQTIQSFKSTKFVVRVSFSPDGRFMATSSYDHTIVIYAAIAPAIPPPLDEDDMPLDETDDILFASEPGLRFEEIHRIKVDSNPEAILFHPESTWLLYTLRSSHLLYYIGLPDADGLNAWETRTKSFNPHPMDNHVSFSVLNLALHPSGKILACQTGDHRGNTGERILLYGVEPDETERLAVLWTGSEGDDFVLPRMSWLPDGSGLITTTPNGYLNLIALNGENRSSVKIHGAINLGQASSEVVRDCVVVYAEDGDWEVISVGYDRQVRISR